MLAHVWPTGDILPLDPEELNDDIPPEAYVDRLVDQLENPINTAMKNVFSDTKYRTGVLTVLGMRRGEK